MNLNGDSLFSPENDPEFLLFGQGAVQEGQDALVGDVRAKFGWISVDLGELLAVVVTVQKFDTTLGLCSL